MTNSDQDLATRIKELVEGYQVSQAIHVAVTLGIADLLAGTSRRSDELAEVTKTHPPTLYRLLRALASLEILRELEDRRFELTPLGELLRSDVPNSIAGWAAFIGRPYYWQAWTGLLHAVQTGENAFRFIHNSDPWTYRSSRPEESEIFDRAMTALSRRSTAALLAAYDFSRFHRIMDVGGGNGALLAAILVKHPYLEGILFDQPHVVVNAPALLERAGVADRCRIVDGSFFEAVPGGADGYLLRSVIHDWEDEEAIKILEVIRRAIPADGTLLLIERVIAPPNQGRDAKLSDLNMLVGPGGRERTREEFALLLSGAHFQLNHLVIAGFFSVLEASPV